MDGNQILREISAMNAPSVSGSGKRKFSVLCDLAHACWPTTSGIPQDARTTFNALATQNLDLTGLLREPSGYNTVMAIPRQICPDNKSTQLEAANFLLGLSGVSPSNRSFFLTRQWRKFWRYVDNLKAGGCIPHSIDKDIFFDSIWRIAFERSLTPEDRDMIRRARFSISNLTLTDVVRSLMARMFRPPRLQTTGYDFALFMNGTPIKVSPGTIKIDRIYDMVPLTDPDTIHGEGGMQTGIHYRAIARFMERTHYVCISEATRQALIKTFPQLEKRSHTIPCVVSDKISPLASTIPPAEIIRTRLRLSSLGETGRSPGLREAILQRAELNRPQRYIMTLCTLEPRKNLVNVIRAWENLRYRGANDIKLVMVGREGWKCEAIIEAMAPRVMTGQLLHLKDVTLAECQALYKNAICLVSPSFNEGFNLPPVEALACGTPSILSDIPVHRWVMEDAALYTNPYDIGALTAQMERLTVAAEAQTLRASLVGKGQRILQRYTPETVGAQWHALLENLYAREMSMLSASAMPQEPRSKAA